MDVVNESSREKLGPRRGRAEMQIQDGFSLGGSSQRVLAECLQELATGSSVVRGERLTGWRMGFRGDEQLVFEDGNWPKEGRMIDAFIIEELKRREREEEQRRESERPFLELPLPIPVAPEDPLWPTGEEENRKPERGVLIIDFAV